MRILITGSRDWPDQHAVNSEINRFIAETCELLRDSFGDPVDYDTSKIVIVHGDCPTGADRMASDWAIDNWVAQEPHPADWAAFGKRAGYLRNAEMVALGASVCLAFIKDNSRGATMTAGLAERVGIPVRRFELSTRGN